MQKEKGKKGPIAKPHADAPLVSSPPSKIPPSYPPPSSTPTPPQTSFPILTLNPRSDRAPSLQIVFLLICRFFTEIRCFNEIK
ncbi:hypothetical protein BDA96_05G106600 [Sorghum bicolor]|uniref:Uncharacterized protein n=2 Tax=Sorghum bicolor TaxID=4558 RepID=A0A921QXP8_SORBI|nr:hypothetical protein BDA96_05G106600 [Sorghum bicolor]KXG28249.1 hypothetical protein SORBI_3005G102700 [Sorghum bicolor]